LFIQSTRLTPTSIALNWQMSDGATRYRLTQAYSNGTLIHTTDLGNVNQSNVDNLEKSVQYLFTVYSGNANGLDLSEGRNMRISTDRIFFFFLFFFYFFYLKKTEI